MSRPLDFLRKPAWWQAGALSIACLFTLAACAAPPVGTGVGMGSPSMLTAAVVATESPGGQTTPSGPTSHALFLSPIYAAGESSGAVEAAPEKVSEWSTYTDPGGVSVQYPVAWEVDERDDGSVVFSPPAAEDGSNTFERYVRFGTSDVSQVEQVEIYPHREPNEGGYEVQWVRPLTTDGVTGVMYVVGSYGTFTRYDDWASLSAVYYSE